MSDLDGFISFLFKNISDSRVTFTKRMKYGYRYYHISLEVSRSDKDTNGHRDRKNFMIVIDNRNQCIELGEWEDTLIVEDHDLVKKWSDIFEDYYQQSLNESLYKSVEDFLSNTGPNDKDFWRQWSMDKLFDDLDKDEDKNENPT